MEKEFIRAEKVTKVFGAGAGVVKAVKGACLTVFEGERIYIHGPSGAGKSTFLQMLGGLSRPSGGSVSLRGKDIYRAGDGRRSAVRNAHFGFVFQFYHLLPELNALENVMLPAMIKGGRSSREIRAEAERLLGEVRMSSRKMHRPGKLSGGEIQRVAIARALINSPGILFCDEPAGNLDSAMSTEIYRLILGVSEKNSMSVIVVSHQEVEKDFFHSEYLMKDGELTGVTERERIADGAEDMVGRGICK
jgi:ABC-type lipoprotein export system ATPase subunit